MEKIGFPVSYLKIYPKDIEFVTYAKLTEELKNHDVKYIKKSKYMKTNRKHKNYINGNLCACFNGFTSYMVLYESLQTE